MSEPLAQLMILVLPILAIIAALKDLVSYTIPNWISLLLLAIFPLAAWISGMPVAVVGGCVAVGLCGLFLGMGMFAMGWIGGGDAKFMASAMLWLGFGPAVQFLIITALAGGALAVSLLAARSVWFRPALQHGPGWLVRLSTPQESVPYGVAIALGVLATFPASDLYRSLIS